MPNIPLVILGEAHTPYKTTKSDFEFTGLDKKDLMKKLKVSEWRPAELRLSEEPELAARELYAQLRELSSARANFIFVRRSAQHTSGLWSAIWNRIEKAASVNLSGREGD